MRKCFKRYVSLLLSVLMLLGLFSVASFATAKTVNLVQNGDFETGSTTGWNVYQNTKVDATAAKTGSYGLYIAGNGGWGGMAQQIINGLEIGKTYRISLWYKALSAGVNIQLCEGSNNSGAKLAYIYGTKTEWTQFAVEFEATTTTVCFALVGSGTNVPEKMYMDDISLAEVVLCGNDDDPNLKMIDTLMDNIKTQGRTALVGGTLMLDFSISGVEFELDCAGDVYATFNARKISNSAREGGVYFTIVVDGVKKARDFCRIASVGETKVKLAENLPAGKHTFAIYRQSEHSYGEVGVCALSFAGEMLAKPAAKSQYIEFIGDSISCGYGNLGNASQGDGSALWSDGTQAYPYLTAKALGADWSNVSWSGLGCKYGYSSTTMQDVYPAQRYNYDKNTRYDFAKEPDVIVLALGTNDNSQQGNTALKRAGLEEMLTLVRAKNPNAPIVWIYNMMTSGVNSMVEEIVKKFGGEKAGYYACSLTRNTSGGGYHPNLAGQQKFAEELVDFLLEKQLCTLSGDSALLAEDGVAQMEMANGRNGLAFRFKLDATGVKMTSKHGFSLDKATVNVRGDGSACRLVGMGVLVTNEVEIGMRPQRMTKANVSHSLVDAPAKYLLKADSKSAWFAVRVVNIPDQFKDMTVYARPYYVFAVGDHQFVVYGAIVSDQYEGAPGMNDGLLDW